MSLCARAAVGATPTREAVDKLIAARLAADCMGVPTIILVHTDAEAAEPAHALKTTRPVAVRS